MKIAIVNSSMLQKTWSPSHFLGYEKEIEDKIDYWTLRMQYAQHKINDLNKQLDIERQRITDLHANTKQIKIIT